MEETRSYQNPYQRAEKGSLKDLTMPKSLIFFLTIQEQILSNQSSKELYIIYQDICQASRSMESLAYAMKLSIKRKK